MDLYVCLSIYIYIFFPRQTSTSVALPSHFAPPMQLAVRILSVQLFVRVKLDFPGDTAMVCISACLRENREFPQTPIYRPGWESELRSSHLLRTV